MESIFKRLAFDISKEKKVDSIKMQEVKEEEASKKSHEEDIHSISLKN